MRKNRDSDHFSRNIDISTFEKNGRCPYFKGFTFVELFIVLALFSLLSLAVYATFVSGMRMWKRINEVTLNQRRALLGMEKFAQEMRQILNYPKIGLTGKSSEISFPALLHDEIIKVTYLVEDGVLVRKEEGLADVLDEKEANPKIKTVVYDLEDLKFYFAYQEPEKEDYSWKEAWEKEEGLPLIVKLQIKTKDGQEAQKSIVIPLT